MSDPYKILGDLIAREAVGAVDGADRRYDDNDAALSKGILSSLFSGAAGVASYAQEQKGAKQKAEADKVANKERDEAISAAKGARKNATDKAVAANVARLKASTEADPNGPLHQAAAEAERIAALYEADARGFEAKAMLLSGGKMPAQGTPQYPGESFWTKYHAGVPTWGWVCGGTAVAGGLLLLVRAIVKKGK